ncbi:hypothetical protein E2553_37780 [Paraburkholderia dipogonis]|uniref:Uncharacterized protein n=1 Tax=Paraburkholderia dipogonis TaxID=1211383 RepID=A0A4Y8ML39_9BURK|nr:hypothetical protein [Paraburkholderia dipogonis]TFE38134.1 hypothetical protein E2553_37780 [Paraburkholderia dipogonis]
MIHLSTSGHYRHNVQQFAIVLLPPDGRPSPEKTPQKATNINMDDTPAIDTPVGRTFYFKSRFVFNAVIVIDALRETDLQTGLTVYNQLRDLRDYAGHEQLIERIPVADAGAMRTALEEIRQRCRDGLRPILHFESHGDKAIGLEISATKDRFSWPALESMLRPINVACAGNLGVVMSVCQGLYAITPLRLHRHAPFYFLLGTQELIDQGALADQLPAFYTTLFETGNLDNALTKVPSCKPFHAEKLLAVAVGRYWAQACMGRGGSERAESLLTNMKWQLGGFNDVGRLREIRQAAKNKIRSDVSAETLQRYADPFLGQRECSFTFEDMLAWLKS